MKESTIRSDMNRRNFLLGAVGAGTLLAAGDLPAVEREAKDVFPRRGRFERLNISMVHVEAGATEPFSVLHISDTHLTEAYPDEDRFKQKLSAGNTVNFGGHQVEALRDSVAWAKANCDYILHTGDMMDWVSQANLDITKKFFGGSPNRLGNIGNHEYSNYHWVKKEAVAAGIKIPSTAETLKRLQQYYPFDIGFASNVINGVNFVSVDNCSGLFKPEQVKRFKAEVKKGLPIVLTIHTPIMTDTIYKLDAKFWKSGSRFRSWAMPANIGGDALNQRRDPVTRDFIAYLRQEPLLKAILAGHLHITIQDRFSPTCMEYVVGGNFLWMGQEVCFS